MKRKRESKKTTPKISSALLGYVLVIIILIILAIIFKTELKSIYSNPEQTRAFISSFGILSPLILILLQAVQVIIFVIPGPIFTIAGGYTFGLALGTIYSMIGTLLGSVLVFYLGKTYGRPFIERIVNKKDLDKFDEYFKKKGKPALLVSRIIPIMFPNDLVSFGASLTKISYRDYIIISIIGFLPNIFILTLFGEKISNGINPLILILISLAGILILLYIFRDILYNLIIKKLKNHFNKKKK